MPEFLKLLLPDEARALLLSHLASTLRATELIDAASSLGRVTAEAIIAPHPLPEFRRSTVDGYAVRARDTFGATDSLPAYLKMIGEISMGQAANLIISAGECALIHTGGMLPEGSDAAVMVEHTQIVRGAKTVNNEATETAQNENEIEILKAVAEGENTIAVGEDVATGSIVIPKGRRIRPAEIGGLMALGIGALRVATKPKIALISSGDEVVAADKHPEPGQVRDVNTNALAALIEKQSGMPVRYGIVPDDRAQLAAVAGKALTECEAVIISAGSSASVRDMTADVIDELGKPGVLIHGVNTRPGKPTILGVCDGKAVIGLPGNPVSALVNGYLFVAPVIETLLGVEDNGARPSVRARLTVNLASQAGREDWWPVTLVRSDTGTPSGGTQTGKEWLAEPIFGKSNLIFSLVAADGLLRISPSATGLSAGELVEVFLL
jgi:molybdopterin molybdotransferase